MHATDGTLDQVELQWDRRVALGVVMAAHGYPAAPRNGDVITGLPAQRRRAAGLPCRHGAGRRPAAHQRRTRAVRHRAGRIGAAGAAARAGGGAAASTSTARSGAATSATAPSSPPTRRHRHRSRSIPRRSATTCSACRRASSRRSKPRTARPSCTMAGSARLAATRPQTPAASAPRGRARLGGELAGRRPVAAGRRRRPAGARRLQFQPRQGRGAAAFGHAAPRRTGRRAVRGAGRFAGHAPAQPLRAHGAHERAPARGLSRRPGGR